MLSVPDVQYTRAPDGASIAYTTFGEGPVDLLCIPGFVSHLELMFEAPEAERYLGRMASFSRVVMYDKRGQGLSDRPASPPTLEESMEDARAVLDAAGVERAAVFGISEGGPMSTLLAASYPERVAALVLYGTWPRLLRSEDYPEGISPEVFDAFVEGAVKDWGGPVALQLWAPGLAESEPARRWWARLLRSGSSPAGAAALLRLYKEIDVRGVLPTITAPTLVLHRRRDRLMPAAAGRAIAEAIPGAMLVELDGEDHLPLVDPDQILDEIEEFLTGERHEREPDRMLATVMFTDIVDSTRKASAVGDRSWRQLVERHDELMRDVIARHRGREVKTMGDGFLVTFDGPARGIRAAISARDAVRSLDIEIRAGLHTGELEVMGGDVGGIAVNIGARVGALARPGEVLVSRTVTDLVAGSGIDFEDRGGHVLKGVPGEWQLFAARG
ncbi:MAG TPA: adenylate/guanylate cyclase domain-containing protein [Solirubrobacteraceae bacterium]|jgi:pimeloyl-ACP methyl ester carboxylesterase|nr:adenylate/guanylate cyclase domain-containing protein [Solirubrobacteraceae bacterium]